MASSPQHEPTMEEILASIRKIIAEDASDAPQAPKPAEPAPEAPVVEPQAAVEDDVLELTEEVVEELAPEPVAVEPEPVPEPVLAEPAPEPEPVLEPEAPVAEALPEEHHTAENDIVFETIEDEEPETVVEPEPEPEMPVAEPVVAAATPAHDLFSDKTRKALDDAFANIDDSIPDDEAAKPAEPPPPLPAVDGKTIEAIFDKAVRETVDPVMTKWLSDNHDAVVARMTPMIREWLDDHFPAILELAVRDEVARVVKARAAKGGKK